MKTIRHQTRAKAPRGQFRGAKSAKHRGGLPRPEIGEAPRRKIRGVPRRKIRGVPRRKIRGVPRRGVRLAAIRAIIGQTAVGSQERLTELLRRKGFPVTQATLSRDLKRLGIGKAPSPDGGYTYILSEGEIKPGSDATYVQDFMRGFLSIEFSGSLGLMRTLPGHASSVASALDNLRIREVLGTIAGDDTVLVVPRSGVAPARLTRAIRARIPGF